MVPCTDAKMEQTIVDIEFHSNTQRVIFLFDTINMDLCQVWELLNIDIDRGKEAGLIDGFPDKASYAFHRPYFSGG